MASPQARHFALPLLARSITDAMLEFWWPRLERASSWLSGRPGCYARLMSSSGSRADTDAPAEFKLETLLRGHARDVDGFTVSRLLPALERKHLGPFCFFDHLGPSELPAGRGLDVRPHPHIGLATVTYEI